MPFPIYSRFRGIDTYTAASQLALTDLQRATNVYAGTGGKLVSRPGKQGLWDVALTNGPIYALTPYLNDDGTTTLFFAQDRRLWRWKTTSAAAPTELKDAANGGASFNFPLGGKFVQMVRHGKYLYGTDGTGPLFRSDNTIPGTGSYGGLTAPVTSPTATLTSTVLLASPGTLPGGWKQDPLYDVLGFDTDLIAASGADPDFQNGWTLTGGADNNNVMDANGKPCVELDQAGESATSPLLLPPSQSGRYARIFQLDFESAAEDRNNNPTERVSYGISGYEETDGTGDEIYSVQDLTEPAGEEPAVLTSRLYDLRSLANIGSEPKSLRVRFEQTEGDSIDVNRVTFSAPSQKLSVSTSATGELVIAQGTVSVAEDSDTLLVGGLYAEHVFAAPQDWSSRSNILLSLRPGQSVAGLRLRLYFRNMDGGAKTYANELAFLPSGSEASVDLSTLPDAALSAFRVLGIEFLSDVLVPGIGSGTAVTLFTLGAITDAGRLSVGFGDYSYLFAEVVTPDSDNPGDFIESSGSPYSAAITATVQQAQTIVKLPASVNPNTDAFPIYRFGGAINSNDDPYPRLVATVPADANATGSGWRWEFATRTFYDNVPDSDLILAQIYEKNRDNFPSGITCLCVANGRLFAAKGNTIHVSWLLQSDAEAALYTSILTDPQDRSVAVKGGTYPLESINNRDRILSLIPLPTTILVLRENSLNLLNGYDPENFATVNIMASAGIGCVAGGSGIVDGNAAYYLAASGVMRYDAANLTEVSLPLQGVLNPRGDEGAPVISPEAYAGCVQVYHDRRRYLFAPVAESNDADFQASVVFLPPDPPANSNRVCYVYDTRTDGYTTFAQMNISSACSLSSSADRQDLFLGGMDGMLYTLRGSVDKATRQAVGVPITVDLLSREYGNETPDLAYFYENRAQNYYFSVETMEATVSLNLTAFGSTHPGNVWSHNYTTNAAGGPTTARVRVAPGIRGERLTQGLTVPVTKPLTISAIGLMTSEGRRLP